jgi:hypothetical protein
MGHIFLSYSRDDIEIVGPLIGRLGAAGVTVWIDREDVQGGD